MDRENDLGKLWRHPYRASFGACDLGPLVAPPEIKMELKRHEARDYDPEGETETARIVESVALVKLAMGDVSAALDLASGFSVGDDVLAPERCGALILAPAGGAPGKVLTFPNACLLPDLEYAPKRDNHAATLSFRARPDSSGALFTFI